jgi:hypothetical protein
MTKLARTKADLIAPAAVRYIKLGRANAWFRDAIEKGRMTFGHRDVPHEVGLALDRDAIVQIYREQGRDAGQASSFAREVLDFYGLGVECLWVTFGNGAMWWGFADPHVQMLEWQDEQPSRYRNMNGGWSSVDLAGQPLTFSNLSTRLTQVSAYRQTLCAVREEAALVRRINGIEEPLVLEARAAQDRLVDIATLMVRNLHWRDFEVLCDLIFARSGWQRIAELGGLQKDTDLVLQQGSTGERAFVQVKSSSDQAELSQYVTNFEADPAFARMFYVCHSPRNELRLDPAQKPVHVWTGRTTAQQAIAAGLFDWLVQKAG